MKFIQVFITFVVLFGIASAQIESIYRSLTLLTNDANNKFEKVLKDIIEDVKDEVDDVNEYLESVGSKSEVANPATTSKLEAIIQNGSVSAAITDALSSYQAILNELIANASIAVDASLCDKKITRSLIAINTEIQQRFGESLKSLGKDFKANIKAEEKTVENTSAVLERRCKACLNKNVIREPHCITNAVNAALPTIQSTLNDAATQISSLVDSFKHDTVSAINSFKSILSAEINAALKTEC